MLVSSSTTPHRTAVSQHFYPVFENQDIAIEEQLELARHFGPLHKHATTAVPAKAGLDEVHGKLSHGEPNDHQLSVLYYIVVYGNGRTPADFSASTRLDLYHSDVTYEVTNVVMFVPSILTASLS